MTFDQAEFDIRFEWGERGVALLAPISDVIIVVDVLSFTTCVDIAVGRGATVFPYRGAPADLPAYAAARGAQYATKKRSARHYTLSPTSLQTIPAGTRLVLPSPNGSTLSLMAAPTPVLAGCLRNAAAVAAAAQQIGRRIAVIAAGERWWPDPALRPSFEDILGAGAIISRLAGTVSPEARGAAAFFAGLAGEIPTLLPACSSGKELIEKGFGADVDLAAQLEVSRTAPQLVDGAYQTA